MKKINVSKILKFAFSGILLTIVNYSYCQFDKLDFYLAPINAGTGTAFVNGNTAIPQGQNVTVNVNVHRSGDGSCASGASNIGVRLIIRKMSTSTDPDFSSTTCHANTWLLPSGPSNTTKSESAYPANDIYTGGDNNPYSDGSILTTMNTGTNQAAGNPEGILMSQISCGTIDGYNATYTFQRTVTGLPTGRYSFEIRADDYDATPSFINSWDYNSCNKTSGIGGGLFYVTVGKQGIFREILVANTKIPSANYNEYYYQNSFQPGNNSVNNWNIIGSNSGSLCQNDQFLIGYEVQTFKNTTLTGNVTGVQLQFAVVPTSGSGNGFTTKTASVPFRTDCSSGSNPGVIAGGGSCISATNNGNFIQDQMWQISNDNTNSGNTTSAIQNGNVSIKVNNGYLDIAQMIKDANSGTFPVGSYNFVLTPSATYGDGSSEIGSTITRPFTISNASGCTIVLALKDLKFALVKNNSSITLNWKTSNDIGVTNFIIEKSTNGYNFTKIGTVIANISETSYAFNDFTIEKKNYYRLKYFEANGDVSYSSILSYNTNEIGEISITPNPAQNFINIKGSNIGDNFVIIDSHGATVYQGQITSSNQKIDIGNFSSGNYFVKIVSNSNNRKTLQFVKQ